MSSQSIVDARGSGYFEELEDKTIDYVRDITTLMHNPLGKTASGSMRSPASSSGSQVFVQEGSGTVKVTPTTCTNAILVYDPEISLRRGRAAVTVYERNSNNEVIKVNTVNIGRVSTDFVSGGVISSTLAVKNTSASEEISGTQTQAVLFSIPKQVTDITATDLLQFATDKQGHLVSNVNSKEDSTITNSFTEHVGAKQALLRDKASSNVASAQFHVSASNQAVQGFIAPSDTTQVASTTISIGATPTITNGVLTSAIYDSGADASYNPFSLESYSAELDASLALQNFGDLTAGAQADQEFKFVVAALDAAGVVLTFTEVSTNPFAGEIGGTVESLTDFDVHFNVNLSSTTVPIARVAVFFTDGAQSKVCRTSKVSSATVKSVTENADISERGVHFCVLEGLNSAAAINIHGANVIAGVPDSKNAFISSGAKNDDILNYAIITNMLVTFRTMMPRAFTGFGRGEANEMLAQYYALEGMKVKIAAMSFGDIGRAFKMIGRHATQARKGASQAARIADPFLKYGGAGLMTGIAGPQGQAIGAGMLGASAALSKAREARLLE